MSSQLVQIEHQLVHPNLADSSVCDLVLYLTSLLGTLLTGHVTGSPGLVLAGFPVGPFGMLGIVT